MKRLSPFRFARALVVGTLLTFAVHAFAQTDPMPSWNDGAAKMAIVEFVRLSVATDPRWKKPYTELTYLPMQEMLK